jgi:hypothetical protein
MQVLTLNQLHASCNEDCESFLNILNSLSEQKQSMFKLLSLCYFTLRLLLHEACESAY